MPLKRKIEKESTNSGFGPKVSKVQVLEGKKKPLTKNEIMLKYKALEEKHEALVKENESNIKEISRLKKEKSPKLSKDQNCQTKAGTEYVEISCTECIFLASSEDELNWHMGEDHDKDYISYFESDFPCSVCDRWCRSEKELNRHMKVYHAKRVKYCCLECNSCDKDVGNKDELMHHKEEEPVEEMNISQSVQTHDLCNFCDQKFETRKHLMVHKKSEHIDKVAPCWNFSAGVCELGDDFCWFSHSQHSIQKEIFNCNVCEQVFNRKKDLQHHKKQEHIMSVPLCRNYSKNTCWYGDDKCWFQHLEIATGYNQQNLINQNQEMTEKVFDMMETFTQRIIQLENQMEMTK